MSGRPLLPELLRALLVALLLAGFTRCFLVQAFRIPTASMAGTLRVGDLVLVNKFVLSPARFAWEHRWLPLREPQRGDVVVFRRPGEGGRDYVKRVVGLPGERVGLRRKRLVVDGRPLAEGGYAWHGDSRIYPHSTQLAAAFSRRDNLPETRLAAATYFVLGDNRDLSEDSRHRGPVRREQLRGLAWLVYWSRSPPAGVEARAWPRWVR